MPISQSTSEERKERVGESCEGHFDRPWAAFIFFTRLPLWRCHQPDVDAYRSIVEWWPLTGWLTAATMAGVLYIGNLFLPYSIAVLLAIVARLMLTGALHEDGLADFFDGFGGGGTNRERILAIMKDSHIGTYGVLALILYMALLYATLSALSPQHAALAILAADPYAKMLSAQAISRLPYARTEATAKSGVVYRRLTLRASFGIALQGLLPLFVCLWYMGANVSRIAVIVLTPFLILFLLYLYIKHRLGGYTGDCCGALCLLTELSLYIAACISI